MSLLMLATLFVYAVPVDANDAAHHTSGTPYGHAHALAGALGDAAVVVAPSQSAPAPCADGGHSGEKACCSVGQCATMHGGVLASTLAAFVPPLSTAGLLPGPAMPEGIGTAPALRPPCLIV